MRRLGRTALLLVAAAVLAAGTGLLTGTLAVVTTFGTSMAPRMAADDLVIVRASSYEVGDVVAYRSPELKQVVLHRIVGADGDLFVFQGDNNDFLDPEQLPASAIVGKELLHVPRGGIWLARLTSPPALAAYAFLLLAGGTAVARTERRRRKERRTVSPRHRSTAPAASWGALPPSLRPVAATAAAVGVLGVALAGLSWTRPTTALGATISSVDSTLDFSYTATVPASAAYDGTTVTAPQPVFRSLTDTVDVTYDYAGRPGRIAVVAELATAGGWRSTVHLSERQPLAAAQQGTVRLHLPALEERAAAAAAVTRIPAGTVTVTVIPRIWMDGGGQFAPELPLTLDSTALKPSSAEALSASTSSSTSGTAISPAQLSAVGRSIGVATARTTSLTAVALAGLLGLALLVLARMHGPVAEADRIRARHKSLLLPVLPIALNAGRPVVDVPDIDALATLAERYGLLILHWQRSGVTTYVVQDEGTTYRFRSGAAQQPPREVELGAVRAEG